MYCFCFLINILILVTVSWWSVGLARLMISFDCSYLHQFLELIPRIAWVYEETRFFLGVFKLINSFRRQLSSRRNNLKLFSDETTLWSIFQVIENRLILIHQCSIDIIDLQRPDWICGSPLTTFQLSSSTEICHVLWGVDSLFHQANRPWKSHWTLHFNHLILDGIHRFISCQSCDLTIQSWNNFWKPLHSLCQSISLFEVHLLTVLESEETVTQSLVESLNDSLISVDVHIPSSYPHIMHCDLTHEFMPRINLKNFWPS